MREYESGSEESLSKFLFNENLAMQQQNYSGYSKYNESYVPTNPDRRLSFERRGSTTSNDDLLTNNLQKQYLHIDPRYRDSRNIVNNISCTTDIKWDANPSILIEEYDDEQINFNKSSESINHPQPLNEESIASCIDSDDIPFIDEENLLEIKNVCGGIMIDRNNRRGSSNGCRKTVSFDTINENLILNDENNLNFNKSKTFENFIENYDDDDDDENHLNDGTNNKNEPIFKFCKMKQTKIKKCDVDDDDDDDSLSFYFCKNDGLTIDDDKMSKKMNLNELKIDLSELTSDSTNTSSSNEIRCVKSVTIKDVPKIQPYKVCWTKPTTTNYGNGKVKALTKYFDFLHNFDENFIKESQSTPDLRFDDNLIKKESKTKLTSNEQNLILKQLKEWSLYGSMGKTDSITKCYLHSNKKPLSSSLINLSSENYGKCKHLDKIYNKIDKVNLTNVKSKSTPNIDQFLLHEDFYKIDEKFPDAFIINKKKICKKNCNSIENCDINLTKNSYAFYNKSCPDLFKSPCHKPKNMTLKQIKKNKRNKNYEELNIPNSFDVVDLG